MYKHKKDAVWMCDKGYLVEYNSNGIGTHRYWSPSQTEYLKKNFPYRPTSELEVELGIEESVIRKKAKQLGIEKDKDYLYRMHSEMARRNCIKAVRRKPSRNGRIKDYINNETPEQKKSRIENSIAGRKRSAILRGIKRRPLTPEQREEMSRKASEARKRAIANGAIEKYKATIAKKSEAEREITRHRMSVAMKKRYERIREEKQSV